MSDLRTNVTAKSVFINFDNPQESMVKRRREAIQAHRDGDGPPVTIRPLRGGPTPCPSILSDSQARNY